MGNKNWSQKVTETSHSLDIEKGVFTWNDPQKIAQSLLQSALEINQCTGSPQQSAMSMLNFYINRAGSKLPPKQKEILMEATRELSLLVKSKKSHFK